LREATEDETSGFEHPSVPIEADTTLLDEKLKEKKDEVESTPIH